jgi:Putative zinc-finger
MNCNEIFDLTPLYLSGELDSQRAGEFDTHLRGCPSCMREIETQSRLDAQLREAVLAEEVDVSRVNRQVRELITRESSEQHVHVSRPNRRRRWVTAAMGVAASLLLLVAGYILVPGSAARVCADAAADHRDEVVDQQPRRWVTEPAKIAALAEQQGVAGSVPMAVASGYHLERAKVCWLDRRSFLHLVYSDGTGEYSLFLRAREGQGIPGEIRSGASGEFPRSSVSGFEHLSSFETSRLTAVVVTDQPADAAQRFAKAVSSVI